MDITSITSQEQLNQIKGKALFNIKSYTMEFPSHTEGIEVDFNNDSWYLCQYNSITELEEVVQGIIEDLNLWDCGDDDFFDCNPDKLGILYQIFRIFQKECGQYLVDQYKEPVINALKDYFDARQSGKCNTEEMSTTYESYLDNFTKSEFPENEDTLY